MRDIDIRKCLLLRFSQDYAGDSSTIVVEELEVCGGVARLDLAVINGSFIGYEIKSEYDNLDRLIPQITSYSEVCDYINIVASKKHLDETKKRIPEWCGIVEAVEFENVVSLIEIRKPEKNTEINIEELLKLLWKEEMISMLSELENYPSLKYKPKNQLRSLLVKYFPIDYLKEKVREALKLRANWRSDFRQKLSDGLCQQIST